MSLMPNIIRPITVDDLDHLYRMANDSGVGVTTLPANRDQMKDKIARAVQGFESTDPKQDHLFLFALHNFEIDEPIGICAIESQIGHQSVWYNYRLGNTVSASSELNIHTETPTLFLSNDLTGATELCTLFLGESFRKGLNGRLLSKSRYLFLAEHTEFFSERVIAEMRGYSDEQGRSPFWESLGQIFFQLTFKDADYLTGLGNKGFIAELMPKYPIYTSFLSQQAQEVIGKVHPNTEPALALLQKEGFRRNHYLDIFDGGPTVECRLPEIRAVKQSQLFTGKISDTAVSGEQKEFKQWLVSNRGYENFRCLLVSAPAVSHDCIELTPQQAQALQIESGHSLRAVPLNPSTES